MPQLNDFGSCASLALLAYLLALGCIELLWGESP